MVIININLLKWSINKNYKINKNTFKLGILNNNLEIVKYVKDEKCDIDTDITITAIENKFHCMFKWILNNKLCIYTEIICGYLGYYNEFDLLQLVINSHNFVWNYFSCNMISKGGCLNILKCAFQKNIPYNKMTIAQAVKSGNLEMVKWLNEIIGWNPS
jgi:hypothetical protein